MARAGAREGPWRSKNAGILRLARLSRGSENGGEKTHDDENGGGQRWLT
jgi:hypothetical protein